jgi:hypothetical protein
MYKKRRLGHRHTRREDMRTHGEEMTHIYMTRRKPQMKPALPTPLLDFMLPEQ